MEKLHLDSIIQSIVEPLCIVDTCGNLVGMNPAYRALFGTPSPGGFEPGENTEQDRSQFEVHDLGGNRLDRSSWPVSRALRGESVRDVELQVRRSDGKSWIVNFNGNAVRDEQNNITHAVLTCSDITARKRAEQELVETKERFRILVEKNPEGIMMTGAGPDNYGQILSANDAALAIIGYTREELFSGPVYWTDLTPPEVLYLDKQAIAEAQVTGSASPYEKVYIRKDGTRCPIRIAFSLVGELQDLAVVFVEDISEQKRATAELERVSRIVSLAHKAAKSGAWELNILTGELFGTEEYYRLYGFDPNLKPAQDTFYSAVHPDDRGRVQKSIEQAIEEVSSEFTTEFRVSLPDGIHWIERRGHVVCDSAGMPVRIVGISMDITERKRLEQALTASNSDLQQFAYVVSHDLQEPLRAVSSFSKLLADRNRKNLDAKSADYIEYIVAGADRMTRLIKDLLDFSRVANAGSTEHRLVDCNYVFQSALRNLELAIQDSAAQICCDPLPAVKGNEGMLVRIFQNLLENAIKYKCPDAAPSIRISVGQRNTWWLFSVCDNGIGFEQRHSERIFKVFQRLHPRDRYSGTGIGLAIVKRAVEHHRGEVWAASEPGRGSTFYFTLPVSVHDASQAPAD